MTSPKNLCYTVIVCRYCGGIFVREFKDYSSIANDDKSERKICALEVKIVPLDRRVSYQDR